VVSTIDPTELSTTLSSVATASSAAPPPLLLPPSASAPPPLPPPTPSLAPPSLAIAISDGAADVVPRGAADAHFALFPAGRDAGSASREARTRCFAR
jgi:hypothetical protein